MKDPEEVWRPADVGLPWGVDQLWRGHVLPGRTSFLGPKPVTTGGCPGPRVLCTARAVPGLAEAAVSSADSDQSCLESNYLFLSLFSLSLSHYAASEGLAGLHWHRGVEMVQWLPSPWQYPWVRWGFLLNFRSPHPSPKRRAGI